MLHARCWRLGRGALLSVWLRGHGLTVDSWRIKAFGFAVLACFSYVSRGRSCGFARAHNGDVYSKGMLFTACGFAAIVHCGSARIATIAF